ncbi:MAG TPA: hypothetical protein VI094_01280 [Propionibacteriaceae bacterium]
MGGSGAGGDDAGDDRKLALFAAFFVGMIICGVQVYNADQA